MIGDTIRYRIYYSPPTRHISGRIVITDTVDSGLSRVTVFNGGRYNARTRVITWTITSDTTRRKAYKAEFAVTGFIGKEMIGGVNICLTKV